MSPTDFAEVTEYVLVKDQPIDPEMDGDRMVWAPAGAVVEVVDTYQDVESGHEMVIFEIVECADVSFEGRTITLDSAAASHEGKLTPLGADSDDEDPDDEE